MNVLKRLQRVAATLGYTLLSGSIFIAAAHADQQMNPGSISQIPLSLTDGVPPNMILSLDESGSMSWAFVPDAAHQVAKNKFGNGTSVDYTSRRIRAVNANPMAYDPGTIYYIPPAFNLDGSELKLTTSFTAAPLNGFWVPSERSGQTGRGKQDLRTNYRLAREHRMGTNNDAGTLNWVNNPSDFDCEVELRSNNTWADCVKENNGREQAKFRITRTSASACTAFVYLPDGTQQNVACSRRTTNKFRVNLTATGVPAYYYEFDESMKGCEGKKGSTDEGGEGCYQLKFVHAGSAYDENNNRLKHEDGSYVDGRENFAIWYSFYRSRALATLSAASIAFYDLSDNVRFTWQNLDTCTTFTSSSSGTGNCGDNRLKPYSKKHQGEFYSWLRRIYFNKGTPLLQTMYRAGEYLKTETPWQRYPHGIGGQNKAENTYACRPSYHVLMTDGMWNVARNIANGSLSDESSFTTPGGATYGPKSYQKQKPFYGVTKHTLADYAMHYWANDLRPGLDNQVPPYMVYKSGNEDKDYWDPRNNPAEWQHMSNFIMGLGLTNALSDSKVPWAGSTHEGDGYQALVDGSANWPPPASDHQNNVYDLWHAAINSRGEFYSVDSPQAMVQAFKDILTRIADRKSSAAGPGISSTMESDGAPEGGDRLATYLYQTSYDSTNWSGEVQEIKRYRVYDPDTRSFRTEQVAGKKASENLPAHNERRIFMANPNGTGMLEFTTANAGAALKESLQLNPETGVSDTNWQGRLNYIRGDQSKEGEGNNEFRERSSLLSDFFSSSPVVVGGARYLIGFSNQLEGNTAYTNFANAIKDRPRFLYVGGNGGMLHAFDTKDMVEKFAFIPTAVMPELSKLTGKNYNDTHQYYVDGTPVVADVYDKNQGKWRTILVGTLRAGGKGIFALDITDPKSDGSGIKLLWELHEGNFPVSINDNPTSVKMGYSFSKPTVARLHDGNWAVVTGNGYQADGSENGKAALFVIDAINGNFIKSLEVQSPLQMENGLSTPTLVDLDGDGVDDYAYAGDLHGNLWRFDLLGESAVAAQEGTTPVNHGSYGLKNDTEAFKVSFGGKPLFEARSSSNGIQSITAAPTVVRHPSRIGYLIAFGTGSYFRYGDKEGDDQNYQSVYGVWDMHTKAQDTSGYTLSLKRSNLFEQKVESIAGGKGVGATTNKEREARGLSNDPVDWFQTSNKNNAKYRGWYFDLKFGGHDGEMVIEKIAVLGDTLFMQTLVPNDDPCASGSSNWLYAINAATGGQTEHHALDTRGSGGQIVSAIKFGSEGGVSISQDEQGFNAEAPDDQEPLTPSPDSLGRQTWRMIHDA